MPKPITMTQAELRDWAKTGVWPDEPGGRRTESAPTVDRPKQPQPVRGVPNKTEAMYASELELQRRAGVIAAWLFQPINLRLAKRTYYEPDFLVVNLDGSLEFHEVKGFWRDDARVKIKCAAEKFVMFRFVAVSRDRGSWRVERF